MRKLFIISLLFCCLLGCADTPTTPQLTEEDVARIVAQEIAKINDDRLAPQAIAQIAVKSTVYLSIKTTNGASAGSGFFVAKDKVATNYHVVKGMISGKLSPAFDHDWYAIAEILATDEARDLAIIGVSNVTMPPLLLGDSDPIWNGETVYVIGNPLNQKGTFSSGMVSAVRPMKTNPDDHVFQITAPISQGSSGGPVLNDNAEVIGVVYSQFLIGQNLNFAIPVNYLKSLLATIQD